MAAALRQLPGAGWRGPGALQELRILQEEDFNADVVGAKACNLVILRQKLPDWILVPR
jgi:hypothetical protein